MTTEELMAAANVISQQASDNPGIGIPVDPEVADYMGAFTEDAIVLVDMMDDIELSINAEGEVIYEGK